MANAERAQRLGCALGGLGRPEVFLCDRHAHSERGVEHFGLLRVGNGPAIFPALNGGWRAAERCRCRAHAAELLDDGLSVCHVRNVRYLRALFKRILRTDNRLPAMRWNADG